jgi:hypothetical protein
LSGNAVQNLLSSLLLPKVVKVVIFKTLILSVVLYCRECWSLKLKEKRRPRVFENRVLREIFVPKRDEMTGGCRKLYNEELHNLCSSRSIIRMAKSRKMKWQGIWNIMWRCGMHIDYFRGNPERKAPL